MSIPNQDLQQMLSEPWSNNDCRGYVIKAMEDCDFSPEDIKRVVAELHYIFDICAVAEASEYYEKSPY